MVYRYIVLFCFLTDTFAKNQLSQRHRSNGGGAGVKPGLLGSLTVGAVPKSTLEPSELLVFGVGAGVVRRLWWPGQVGGRNTEGSRHRTPRALLRRRPGAPAVSRARRGWRRAWRGWARGRAAAARGGWLAPGRATSTAGAAATAPTTPPPPPPGARTGRPGPKASSCLSGMQVLLLKCLGSAGVCCKGCISASVVSLQLDPYAFG